MEGTIQLKVECRNTRVNPIFCGAQASMPLQLEKPAERQTGQFAEWLIANGWKNYGGEDWECAECQEERSNNAKRF